MIETTIKASVLLLMTWCGVGLLKRQSAAVRHLIWTAGLFAALTMPILGIFAPTWQFSVVEHSAQPSAATTAPSTTVIVSAVPEHASTRFPLTRIVFFLWIAGVGVGFVWLLAAVSRLVWIAHRAKTVTSDRWRFAQIDIARQLRLKRPSSLVCDGTTTTLGAWGVFRGRVLLPDGAEHWPEDRIRLVLTHELAHIKRHDWPIQMIAEVAKVIYWFNPLFWIVCSRLRRESEHACDDVVLTLGTEGQTYATHLLQLARDLRTTKTAAAILAMAQPPNIERRFVAMLNPSLNRRPASVIVSIVIGLATLSISLPLAGIQTQSTIASKPEVANATVVVTPAAPAKTAVAPASRPQVASGNLSGTIYDPSGAIIIGAEVTATNLVTKVATSVETGAPGTFEFRALPSGDYSVLVQMPGFINARIERLTVGANQDVKQDVSLILGNISERVVITAEGQPKPPTLLPPGTPRRIRVGGNVQSVRLLHQVKPVYPSSAQNSGVEGTVRLQAIIGVDGSLSGLRVLSSIDADLTTAALEAVRQWRYSPTLLNGVPVETLTNIDVEFKQPQ